MLELVPRIVGKTLEGARAGVKKLVYHSDEMAAVPELIRLRSPAFNDGERLPARFTADGAKISPPLNWDGVPADAAALVLIVEDPDAPMPNPLVHCIAWDLPLLPDGLAAGDLRSPGLEGAGHALGRNSFLKAEYLPPDPPTGHGPHRYGFQLFALDRRLDLREHPGRSELVSAMQGRVIAKGMLTGLYERP